MMMLKMTLIMRIIKSLFIQDDTDNDDKDTDIDSDEDAFN